MIAWEYPCPLRSMITAAWQVRGAAAVGPGVCGPRCAAGACCRDLSAGIRRNRGSVTTRHHSFIPKCVSPWNRGPDVSMAMLIWW